jgi:hypothetical protein
MGQPRWPETIGPLIVRFKSPIRRIGLETCPVNAAIVQVKSTQNHMSGNANLPGLDHISFFNWSRVFIWQSPVLLLQRNLKVAVRRH